MTRADVLVIGGGAAGLMCAITAGQHGRNVIVLEGSNRIGKKILMSGGGRCNFTNLYCEPSNFLSHNLHFCKSALSRYTQHDFVALVEKHGIAYHEKTAGQLFCDVSSKDIVAMLQRECDDAGVQIVTECGIQSVTHDREYRVDSARGAFSSQSLVVASGGLSIPKMGATGLGYDIARQFGLKVFDTRAGLVPFTFTGAIHDLTERLSGVSARCTVTANGVSFTEDVLFTHRGLSGPAVLQVSSFWYPGDDVELDLLPDNNANKVLLTAKTEQPRGLLRTALAGHLPRALVNELQDAWWPAHADTPLAEIANDVLLDLGSRLHRWTLKPAATEGYRTAEVTLGGVDTGELSSRTMEARRQPGLYFIGEVVDVTGHLGGFNFQWAWASGHAAGLAV
ncbi:MAG: NAD(P)/FAD-dependent oxidoreductase [Chromatiales bacterium]|nr:MAG: NAD(P)/FAD-dependent oxidoreductase [Chromatiales bacterium]